MAHAKVSLFFLMLLILSSSSAKLIIGENHIDASNFVSIKIDDEIGQLHHKVGVSMKSRKLLETEVVQLDYDYPGPNPKHDPRKGRGGGGKSR